MTRRVPELHRAAPSAVLYMNADDAAKRTTATAVTLAGAAACGLVAPACDLAADEACADGVISFCDWDAPGSVDCVAAGYGDCATTMLGSRRVAYCTP